MRLFACIAAITAGNPYFIVFDFLKGMEIKFTPRAMKQPGKQNRQGIRGKVNKVYNVKFVYLDHLFYRAEKTACPAGKCGANNLLTNCVNIPIFRGRP